MEERTEITVPDTAPQVDGTDSITAEGAPVGMSEALPSGEGTTPLDEGMQTMSKEGEIVYRFNHETRSVSQKEAPDLIQKLLKSQHDYEHKVVPQLDRLRRLAGADEQELDTVVEHLERVVDEAEYRRFLEQSGGNEAIARGLVETSRKLREQRASSTATLQQREQQQEGEALTRRLGEELADLQAEFPDIREITQLPEQVVAEAVAGERSLLDGYLRHRHRDRRQAAQQQEKQAQAAAASAGSLRGEPESVGRTDEQASAFSAAFKKRFG